MSMYTLIVFFKGKSTTCPGPIVQGPPIKDTNLVFTPTLHIKLTAICMAAPVALFYLFYRRLKYESASSYSIAFNNLFLLFGNRGT